MAQVLKRRFPGVHVAMLIREYTADLVSDHPFVDSYLNYDHNDRPTPFFRLRAILRSERFDVVIHTHPRIRLALLTWLARIPVRVGTGYRWYSMLFNRRVYEHRKDAQRHELEYNLRLLETVGCSIEGEKVQPSITVRPEVLEDVRDMLAKLDVSAEARIVILHPGSGGSARDWREENFGMLGERLARVPNVKVLITGGKGEGELCDRVRAIAGNAVVAIVDRLTLEQYAALARMSALFIANSTGTIHIAAAVGAHVLGLYPTITALNAARWGPYTAKRTIIAPHQKPTDCRNCDGEKGRRCECMDSISVDEVYTAAVLILDGGNVARDASLLTTNDHNHTSVA